MNPSKVLEQLREEKAAKYKGGLYHKTQVLLAYNSNRIEGSRLTEEQTRLIFETNTILPDGKNAIFTDDIIETENHFALFDYMLDHAEDPLSEDLIKEFHAIIKRATSIARNDWFRVGDYKALRNEVGGRETVEPEHVAEEIRKLLDRYRVQNHISVEDIIDFHAKFERIHPFQDGNGRVGRVIMFKECLKNGIMPFIIDAEHKAFYYRGLSEYSHEMGFLIDTCLSAQDHYAAICQRLMPCKIENQMRKAEEQEAARPQKNRGIADPER